jgi:chemosensory pili system protein ChpA (sensor histidine kinase/response regulator)
VLVVEDDWATRELYRSALRQDGYSVIAVSDGLDALTYLDMHTPAAVVLDLGLPRLDGRDVIREMRGNECTERIPVVVVTGQDAIALHDDECRCVLRKPVCTDRLLDEVRSCVSKR